MAQEKTITEYEVMFTVHTGVTVLTEKLPEFDDAGSDDIIFRVMQDTTMSLETSDTKYLLKDLKKDYLDEARERGFIMLYELEDDEVVRCTPCQMRNQ